MKKILIISVLFLSTMNINAFAQHADNPPREQYSCFNLGVGIGYYGYITSPVPVIMLSYEFDVARNFTLAPFVGYYSYSNNYYYGNPNNPYNYYSYRETVVPVGLKGAYYFDELLNANKKWDFYAAASLGFQFHTITWDNSYSGDKSVAREASPLYAAAHIGARYNINRKVGLFLDLSTGISTFGLSF